MIRGLLPPPLALLNPPTAGGGGSSGNDLVWNHILAADLVDATAPTSDVNSIMGGAPTTVIDDGTELEFVTTAATSNASPHNGAWFKVSTTASLGFDGIYIASFRTKASALPDRGSAFVALGNGFAVYTAAAFGRNTSASHQAQYWPTTGANPPSANITGFSVANDPAGYHFKGMRKAGGNISVLDGGSAYTWSAVDGYLSGPSNSRKGDGINTSWLHVGVGYSSASGAAGTFNAQLSYLFNQVCPDSDYTDTAEDNGWTEITDASFASTARHYGNTGGTLTHGAGGISVPVTGDGTTDAGWAAGNGYLLSDFPPGWRGDGTQAIAVRCKKSSGVMDASLIMAVGLVDNDGNGAAGGSGVITGWVSTSGDRIKPYTVGEVADEASAWFDTTANDAFVYGLIMPSGAMGDTTTDPSTGTNLGHVNACIRSGTDGSYPTTSPASKNDAALTDGVRPILFVGTSAGWTGARTVTSEWWWKCVDVIPSSDFA